MKMINSSGLTYRFQIDDYGLKIEVAPGEVCEVPDEYATRPRFLEGHAPGLRPYVEPVAAVVSEEAKEPKVEEPVDSELSLKPRVRRGRV